MRKFLLLSGVLSAGLFLAACTLFQGAAPAALQSVGVDASTAQTITTDAALAGQLICKANDTYIAVSGANVKNAKSQAVADVCTAAEAGSTPVAPPSGTVATLVNVAEAVLDTLNASKAAS